MGIAVGAFVFLAGLPAESELQRFPPEKLARQWCAVAKAFSDHAWGLQAEDSGGNWDALAWEALWRQKLLESLIECHEARGWRRRLLLLELRREMPPAWWVCPPLIEIVPYRMIRREPERPAPRWFTRGR